MHNDLCRRWLPVNSPHWRDVRHMAAGFDIDAQGDSDIQGFGSSVRASRSV